MRALGAGKGPLTPVDAPVLGPGRALAEGAPALQAREQLLTRVGPLDLPTLLARVGLPSAGTRRTAHEARVLAKRTSPPTARQRVLPSFDSSRETVVWKRAEGFHAHGLSRIQGRNARDALLANMVRGSLRPCRRVLMLGEEGQPGKTSCEAPLGALLPPAARPRCRLASVLCDFTMVCDLAAPASPALEPEHHLPWSLPFVGSSGPRL